MPRRLARNKGTRARAVKVIIATEKYRNMGHLDERKRRAEQT